MKAYNTWSEADAVTQGLGSKLVTVLHKLYIVAVHIEVINIKNK